MLQCFQVHDHQNLVTFYEGRFLAAPKRARKLELRNAYARRLCFLFMFLQLRKLLRLCYDEGKVTYLRCGCFLRKEKDGVARMRHVKSLIAFKRRRVDNCVLEARHPEF